MAGPPINYTPGSLAAKLAERPSPSKIVPFPGRSENIRICVPPERVHTECRLKGAERIRIRMERELKRKVEQHELATEVSKEVIGDSIAKELLAEVCMSAESIGRGPTGIPIYERLFVDADWIENTLTADEIAILFREFQIVQLELGPRLTCLTEDDLDAWISRLKAGLWELGPLASLSWLDLAELTRYALRKIESTGTNGSPIQESQQSSLDDSSESNQQTSQTDTIYYGELPKNYSHGTDVIPDLLDDAVIASKARLLPKP